MGWLPDYPDFRDLHPGSDEVPSRLSQLGQKDSIKTMLQKIGIPEAPNAALPPSQDLRDYCSPVEDQENLGSCTAHAGVGLVEYFERRAHNNKYIDASRLFLYKTTRNLMHQSGDVGGYLRKTMASLVLFGVPPEEYWPYDIDNFDEEPPAFCYAFAQNYQAITYYRLDKPGTSADELLQNIKAHLAAKLPSMFGFTVYSSIYQAEWNQGKIPYPGRRDIVISGHAMMAVGYDDSLIIEHKNKDEEPTMGALLIRNSWGVRWGDDGYGWLPYKYVLQGLADDWWTLLNNEWVDLEKFKFDYY